MRFAERKIRLVCQPAIAAGLIVLLCLQLALAASETLHKFFHTEADQPGHECCVTLFAHGQVETTPVVPPCLVPVTGMETTPRLGFNFLSCCGQPLPPGRGPPVPSPVA